MNEHDHTEHVSDCFRCDLSRDETAVGRRGLTDEQLAEIEADLTVRDRVSGTQTFEENLAVIHGERRGTTIGDADRRVRAAAPVLLLALRDARAENERLRGTLGAAAKTLTWLPSQYTVAEENALRVVSLLHSDCYRLGAELAALAAPTGQEADRD